MQRKNVISALLLLADVQRDTAPITVRIGGTTTDGLVEHNQLYVLDAPPAVVKALLADGFSIGVEGGGVRVEDYTKVS